MCVHLLGAQAVELAQQRFPRRALVPQPCHLQFVLVARCQARRGLPAGLQSCMSAHSVQRT